MAKSFLMITEQSALSVFEIPRLCKHCYRNGCSKDKGQNEGKKIVFGGNSF